MPKIPQERKPYLSETWHDELTQDALEDLLAMVEDRPERPELDSEEACCDWILCMECRADEVTDAAWKLKWRRKLGEGS